MKSYTDASLKVLRNYFVFAVLFVGLLVLVIVLTSDKIRDTVLYIYSSVMFFLAVSSIFMEMNSIGVREKKPEYRVNGYPLKGLVYGVIGFLPVFIIFLIVRQLPLGSPFLNQIRHLALNAILAPTFLLIKLGRESSASYFYASAVVPVTAALGYLLGYLGIEVEMKKKQINKRT